MDTMPTSPAVGTKESPNVIENWVREENCQQNASVFGLGYGPFSHWVSSKCAFL
jgi:hypothetical protein